MGIKGAHFFTHSISNVSLGELYQISLSRKLFNQQSTSGTTNDNFDDDIIPTIDIDASWVFRSSSIVLENRLSWMMNIGVELAKVGFIVVFVCDESVRHHSKRSTIFRNSKFKIKTLVGLLMKTELMLLQEKKDMCISIEEKNQIMKQETQLSTKIRAIDAQQQISNVDVVDQFFQNIKDFIDDFENKNLGNRHGKLIVIKALFQADSVIANRCISKICDIVFSSDSDLAALAGEQFLAIKAFKFLEKSRGEKLLNIVLYTPSTLTLQRAMSSICLLDNSDKIKKSKFAIFDNIHNINIRGLLAVGIGCDVLLSGVPGIGKSKIQNFINNTQQLTYENIMKFYCDSLFSLTFSPYIFIDAINIHVQAFI